MCHSMHKTVLFMLEICTNPSEVPLLLAVGFLIDEFDEQLLSIPVIIFHYRDEQIGKTVTPANKNSSSRLQKVTPS